ncbi:hypothetical protein [Flavivirga spongiicola]|uniref:Alkaline phosphatase n=1 Tax=Flavivirga spongiicola TaxID=421621 RepID=A0ABU7XNK5_9FLAO|nr:hypothetical protein [Flavivirga sp. MEBiC05379]MDO5977350.1 hypothetical protein [Flavivirga sp. MEBiC05379]
MEIKLVIILVLFIGLNPLSLEAQEQQKPTTVFLIGVDGMSVLSFGNITK